MNKQEFFAELRKGLSGLPEDEIEERLAFYEEMAADLMEDGLSESEAVEKMGNTVDIVKQTIEDVPVVSLIKEKTRPKRPLRVWEIILLVLGSPIWLSVLLCVAVVILSLYVVLYAIVAALWCVEIALWVCALGGIASGVIFAVKGNPVSGAAVAGAGVACSGIAIFMFFACKAITKGIFLLTKKMLFAVKNRLAGKEVSK